MGARAIFRVLLIEGRQIIGLRSPEQTHRTTTLVAVCGHDTWLTIENMPGLNEINAGDTLVVEVTPHNPAATPEAVK